MAILRITKHGEKVLKTPSVPVDYNAIKSELPQLLKNMWATMRSVKGVGLAAPQIGLNIRLCIIDVRPEGKPQRLVLINPEIIDKEGRLNEEEGCLSLPGIYAKIKRAAKARVRAINAEGELYELTGEGLLARAFQHEVDHLDGKLFIDHLDFTNKMRVLSIVKDIKKDWN
jgi:peptide deformylase